MKKRFLRVLLILLLILLIAWYILSNTSGSDFADMVDQAEVDMVTIPQDDPELLTLLEKYKPNFHVDKDSYIPMDFYKDYLPQTSMFTSGWIDRQVASSVSSDMLKTYHLNNGYYLDYDISHLDALALSPDAVTSTVYGRGYRSILAGEGSSKDLIFLKYSLVFPYSGLPQGTPGYKKLSARLIGNPLAWHELDIHGAVHIVLDGDSKEPLGVILAQHNHHQVLLKDIDFKWPKDHSVDITFATYSNEPYMSHSNDQAKYHRVISTPSNPDYLLGITDRQPLTGGTDTVAAASNVIELKTPLVLLPLDDPLYTAHMSLGDRRKILGLFRTFYIEGPPGINYYAMPALKDMANLMAFWYVTLDDDYLTHYKEADFSYKSNNISDLMTYQKNHLLEALTSIIGTH